MAVSHRWQLPVQQGEGTGSWQACPGLESQLGAGPGRVIVVSSFLAGLGEKGGWVGVSIPFLPPLKEEEGEKKGSETLPPGHVGLASKFEFQWSDQCSAQGEGCWFRKYLWGGLLATYSC